LSEVKVSFVGVEGKTMKGELRILNLLCFATALLFLAGALINALFSGQFLTTDNLFITMVCLVMALVFLAVPLLQLKEEGRLPIPFRNRIARQEKQQLSGSPTPQLLDAKGRAVPPDVRAMVSNMRQPPPKE
jgi:hypothetical protein